MAKKKSKYTIKTKGRMFIIFMFFLSIISTLSYTLFTNLKQINDIRMEKRSLNKEKSSLVEKQESLKADIEKLSDSEYIAKYAREKYFYSKQGEIILRIDYTKN